MFTELMSLIEHRPLTITVAVLNDGRRIRVNVVPQKLEQDDRVNEKIGYSNRDKVAKVPDEAIKALTTPLSLTGAAEDIDAELAQALREFAESHAQLQKTVDQAKERIAEAVKGIEDREKNKAKIKATVRPTPTGEDGKSDKAGSNNPGLFDADAVHPNTGDGKVDL
jgi:PRTRC genetic system protein E